MLNTARKLPEDARNRAGSLVPWATALAVLTTVLAAVNFYILVPFRQNIIAREEAAVLRIADAVAQGIEDIVKVTALALENTAATIQARGMNAEEAHQALKLVSTSLPYLRMTAIVDLEGNILHSANSIPPPKVNLGHREDIAYYLEGGHAKYFVSGPYINQYNGQWTITVSRAIRDARGVLQAVQISSVDPIYVYSELLFNGRDVEQAADGTKTYKYFAALLNGDMQLIARSPKADDHIGKSIADGELYRALSSSGQSEITGVFKGYFTGDDRVSAARWLADRRFIVSVTSSLYAVLTYWRAAAIVTAASSALLLLAVIAIWLRTARESRAQRMYADQLFAVNEELAKQTTRAEHSARAKTEFLANMSHEIRTPLNAITGYSELALEDHSLTKETRRRIMQVFNASNSLRVIIDDILDLSRIEVGGLGLSPASFSIAEMIDDCQSIVSPLIRQKRLTLKVSTDPNIPPWLVADGIRVRQVLLNLVNNAIKFTESGSVEIVSACEAIGNNVATVKFSIADTGVGIPDDKLQLIFERFQQVDSSISRRYGGTGLGLTISKAIVTLMGGDIGVSSREGSGSVFWFRLHLPIGSEPRLLEEVAAAVTGLSLKVLVVDDLELNCDLAKTLLMRAGHSVQTALSGASAVLACKNYDYDLVLMDIQMPGLDGMEATRQIRQLGPHASTMPIVAMTTNVMPDQIELYRAAGMNGHLAKPIDRAQLAALLARWSTASQAQPAEAIGSAGKVVHDRRMLGDVREALGWQQTQKHLHRLSEILASDVWSGDVHSQEMVRTAHMTISLAGQLGFSALSAAAYDLEAASLGRCDFDAALKAFLAARTSAMAALEQLIAESAAQVPAEMAASA